MLQRDDFRDGNIAIADEQFLAGANAMQARAELIFEFRNVYAAHMAIIAMLLG